MPPNTAAASAAAHAQEKTMGQSQPHVVDPMNHCDSRAERFRQQEASNCYSIDSCDEPPSITCSVTTDSESDEDMKTYDIVPKVGKYDHVVPSNEEYDTFEESDDFMVVNRCSPGLSSSFSEMKTCDDRTNVDHPKQRCVIRKKPYDYVKEDVKEKSALAKQGHVDQSMEVTAILQPGAASLQSQPSVVSTNQLAKASQSILDGASAEAIVKQEDCKQAAPVDFEDVRKKLREFVRSVLSVDQLLETFKCCGDAKKLRTVAMIMMESNQLHKFLMVFGHSASCTNDSCTNTCRMFRRTRGHVGTADHPCALMHVYSQLLRMHIDTCVDDKCGLVTCKSMLAMRQVDNLSVLPRHFKQLELLIALKTGKTVKQLPAVNKVDASENKENIDQATTLHQAKQETESSGALNLIKTKEILSEVVGDQALDLSTAKGGPPDVQKATLSPCV